MAVASDAAGVTTKKPLAILRALMPNRDAAPAAPANLDKVVSEPVAPEDVGTVSKGPYSYTLPEGVVITVRVADEKGFDLI